MPHRYYSHPTAVIDGKTKIGDGTKIWHFCHISSGAVIGKECTIGQNVYVGGRSKIGDHVKIQNNVSVYDGVTLDNYVFCGPSVVFTNDINPRSKYPKHGHYVETRVNEGASLGANATIVCGTTIGRYAFIGSGSVVTGDIPDYALAYGVPARTQGWICECGEKLPFTNNDGEITCAACKRQFSKRSNKVQEVV